MPACAGTAAESRIARHATPPRYSVGLLACGNRDFRLGPPFPLALQPLGHDEGEFERLVGIEPRIALGVVAVREIGLGDGLGPADALGDVPARHLGMYSVSVRPLAGGDVEEGFDFARDELE